MFYATYIYQSIAFLLLKINIKKKNAKIIVIIKTISMKLKVFKMYSKVLRLNYKMYLAFSKTGT